MSGGRDLLIELGTEELPPGALQGLSAALSAGIRAGLQRAGLEHGALQAFAAPRRLAVLVEALAAEQPARHTERRGPALNAAFDAEGAPTRAALGFARSCGVEVDALQRLETEQGGWLVFRSVVPAQPTATLIPDLLAEVLAQLPIARRMRWGDGDAEFVRPVRWLVVLHGEEVIDCAVLGVQAGRLTHGHRFHCPQPLALERAGDYQARLLDDGHVVADFARRRARVESQVRAVAATLGGTVVIDPALLDEVTALTEWPVAVAGNFDARFLEVPAEALVATMKGNQRYFHLLDADGALLPAFITVANLDSRNPQAVRHGNERVIRPRLADAEFFYQTDLRQPLAGRLAGLEAVVFQHELGSIADRSRRVSALARHIAEALGEPAATRGDAERAGLLCKCDLITAMVGEFPELQGLMGARYAAASGEPEAVATAIGEHYLPAFAGDRLPLSRAGMAVAIADRLDTLTGIFGIGQPPGGDRDPFALRRAALGVLRILIEAELDLDLPALLRVAAAAHRPAFQLEPLTEQVFDFMTERLRAYFAEQGVAADVFAAVLARRPARPLDFARRVHAVQGFRELPAAASLAAANKRIQNILRQAEGERPAQFEASLLREQAERALAAGLLAIAPAVHGHLAARDHAAALALLAGLREAVDAFFDTVRVMDDDPAVRGNRLALLADIAELFLQTADISLLQPQ